MKVKKLPYSRNIRYQCLLRQFQRYSNFLVRTSVKEISKIITVKVDQKRKFTEDVSGTNISLSLFSGLSLVKESAEF